MNVAWDAESFAAFYRELHAGREAYAWQARAAHELASGRIFDQLEAPTGSGKTTLVECFLFALAAQAENAKRRLPRRLFWVIDRRAVVDQVYEHVDEVSRRLQQSEGQAVQTVRKALSNVAGGGDALHTARWRGGIEREVTKLDPRSPAVICTTIDQVGSRLLFRGYGTSRRSRPIDAALVGTDSLLVLDEAHLAGPFHQTASAVVEAQRAARTARPLRLMIVSATLATETGTGDAFRLDAQELAEPALAQRLKAEKRARVVRSTQRVKGVVAAAKRAMATGGVVGVVLNTVADAREVHRQLSSSAQAILVVGPSRPFERDRLLGQIPRRELRTDETNLFVVATQTIEVGVDLDFDALVTAAAPWPALVQRLGRLDRAGAVERTEATIVATRQQDFVYGEAAAETADWLDGLAAGESLDLGPRGIAAILASSRPPAAPPGPRAPLLCPWHLEALSQTSDDPVPSPDVGVFLHGETALEVGDVRLLWRADLSRQDPETWRERIEARRPVPGEMLALPVNAVRRWLLGQTPSAVSDVGSPEHGSAGGGHALGPVLRVPPRPDQRPEPIDPRSIKPGDVLVAPATYGGCDRFGWDPASTAPVRDIGDLAGDQQRCLLDDRGPAAKEAERVADLVEADLLTAAEAYDELLSALREALQTQAMVESDSAEGGMYAPAIRRLADGLPADGELQLIGSPEARSVLMTGSRPRPAPRVGSSLTYDRHVFDVRSLAQQFCTAAGLSGREAESVLFAAAHHDVGKLDPRFQAWLNGGTPADPDLPLAKSGRTLSWARSESERVASGWPRGKRHEALSAIIAAGAADARAEVDPDLALHLILTHHGQHRPFFPAQETDDAPVDVTVSIDGQTVTTRSDQEPPFSSQAERFARLLDRYGPWGLASIEAVLVLADRIASAKVEE